MHKDIFLTASGFQAVTGEIESFYDEHVEIHTAQAAGGLHVRAALISPPDAVAQIAVIPGRGETAHKYAEFLYCMYQAGIKTAVLFARGQGISDRLLKDHQRCHIDKFGNLTSDIVLLISELGFKDYGMLAFSLGGLIALDFVYSDLAITRPKKLALIAPFLYPAMKINPRLLAIASSVLGSLPVIKNAFTPYGREYKLIPFDENHHSHCEVRYKAYHDYYASHKELTIGSPTWGFVKETTLKQRQLFSLKEPLPVPIYVQTADEDKVVSSEACRKFFKNHQQDPYTPIVSSLSGAYHDVLNEIDEIRNPALNRAIEFLLERK